MFEIISTITSILFVVILAVMFIGYWTYADYYTQLNITFVQVYWVITCIILGIIAEVFVIGLFTDGLAKATSNIKVFLRAASVMEVSCILLYVVIGLFNMSRNYFGKKRNKI